MPQKSILITLCIFYTMAVYTQPAVLASNWSILRSSHIQNTRVPIIYLLNVNAFIFERVACVAFYEVIDV